VDKNDMSKVGALKPKTRKRPNTKKRKVAKVRDYLTPQEVEKLMAAAARVGRYGHRDATLMLLCYRHGLRVSELVALRWGQIDLKAGLLHVNRQKNGITSVHPLRGPEMRALRRMKREDGAGVYVFMTERGGPMTTDNVRKLVQRAAQEAKLPFPVHPHMLRHSCGYKLANDGHDTRAIQHYLGHRNIQNTVRYTQLSPQRFKDFWKD